MPVSAPLLVLVEILPLYHCSTALPASVSLSVTMLTDLIVVFFRSMIPVSVSVSRSFGIGLLAPINFNLKCVFNHSALVSVAINFIDKYNLELPSFE